MGVLFLLLLAACGAAQTADDGAGLLLAADGRTEHVILLDPSASEGEGLAAAELAKYLRGISGATFPVRRGEANGPAIVLCTEDVASTDGRESDGYAIRRRGDSIELTGASPRAVLYAAYDLLGRLGCQWLAPDLEPYDGAAEVVPSRATLVYEGPAEVVERPAFAMRTIDLAQAASQNTETLRKVVEWMPKVRFNTLRITLNHGGNDRIVWDNWRDALTPELEKRGITIEVGGHGYQNFLSAEMEGGTLFQRHPDWFGKDSTCQWSPAEHLVFNAENPDAVDYLMGNVLAYLETHPEVDVFDFWPPDGARWAECAAQAALGSVQDRQVKLVNRLHAELAAERPDLRLQMIAYAHALLPPETVRVPEDVIVDFCPIDQSFDAQIYDLASGNNAQYVHALRAWRRQFPGHIGVYTYYRKYAWRSMPNVIPHYIQKDLQWYASVPVQGISTYAEPADWYTYELNHLAVALFAWNPDADADSLVEGVLAARYGDRRDLAAAAMKMLEDEYRLRASIPFSADDTPQEVAAVRGEVEARLEVVRAAAAAAPAASGDAPRAANLGRLALMLELAARDLEIQERRARGASAEELAPRIADLVDFLAENADRGVFLSRSGDLARYTRHYTREWPMLDPAEAA